MRTRPGRCLRCACVGGEGGLRAAHAQTGVQGVRNGARWWREGAAAGEGGTGVGTDPYRSLGRSPTDPERVGGGKVAEKGQREGGGGPACPQGGPGPGLGPARQCPQAPGCSQAAQPEVTFIEESALKRNLRKSYMIFIRDANCAGQVRGSFRCPSKPGPSPVGQARGGAARGAPGGHLGLMGWGSSVTAGAHGQGRAPALKSPEGLVGVQGPRAPGWVSWCRRGSKGSFIRPAPRGDVFLSQGYILVLWPA